jgi:hypothetical protein
MRRFLTAFMALASMSVLVACNKPVEPVIASGKSNGGKPIYDVKPPIVVTHDDVPSVVPTEKTLLGTWEAKENEKSTLTVVFKPDHSITFKIAIKVDPEDTLDLSMDGTYKLEGDQLTDHYTKKGPVTVTGPKSAALTPLANKQSVKIPPDEISTLTWSGNDMFTAANAKGGKVVFKRVSG